VCDKALTDYESTRKDKETGEFLDLCGADYAEYKRALNEMVDTAGFSYHYNLNGNIT
jgi:hypothetical protein